MTDNQHDNLHLFDNYFDSYFYNNTAFDSQTTNNAWFAHQVLAWFECHGRKHLPWQQLHTDHKNPYPVWISEIMLQQTQVVTVIDYFKRFMTQFETVDKLANSDLAQVLALWAGLGYYARAKNLHKGAKQLVQIIKDTGDYPKTCDEWQNICGVGRSTAGAIVAMGLGGFGVICDGNVKRVLTRHFGIDGDITKSATDKILWQLATDLTPKKDSGKYAQAMMDLGATVCTRTRPNCQSCPVVGTCHAFLTNSQHKYPVKAKKVRKPTYQSFAVMIRYDNQSLWLCRSHKIWQNLWCLPLFNPTNLQTSRCETQIFDTLNLTHTTLTKNISTTVKHSLTHFDWQLDLVVYPIGLADFERLNASLINTDNSFIWTDNYTNLSTPVGINKLLAKNLSQK